jgi:thiol-disulfide isomerase/thioredoxin/uncharacterized protein YoaH (UPF0181 family)
MRNILAILMMVSFAASAAQESNTEKLNKALATGVSTGKNVLIVSNKITKESPNKEKDREKMNLEMRKLFAEIRTNRSDRSTDNKIKKLRNDFNSKYRYDISFLNKPSFKEYAAKNLVVVNINVGDVKDLPNKLKDDFRVRNLPSVILVKKDKVVHRMRSMAGQGRGITTPAWVFISLYTNKEQRKEKLPKARLNPPANLKSPAEPLVSPTLTRSSVPINPSTGLPVGVLIINGQTYVRQKVAHPRLAIPIPVLPRK